MMNALLNKIFKSPLPPFAKGGLRGVTGMTLVEVMVAMVISLIIFLALMQTSLISIDHNMRNTLRDEAGRIAEERMSRLKNLPFDNADLNDTNATVGTGTTTPESGIPRTIRNFSLTFTPTRIVDEVNTNTKEVTVRVSWTWKGQTYTQSITTVLKRNE